MGWDYFREGQYVGPLKVVTVLEIGQSQGRTRYELAFRCCGQHVEKTHYEALRRERKGATRCRACYLKESRSVPEPAVVAPAKAAAPTSRRTVRITVPMGETLYPAPSKAPLWAPASAFLGKLGARKT